MCHAVASSSRLATASARRSVWRTGVASAAATLAAVAALALAGPAFALPPANADRAVDPPPKPLLSKPAPAPKPATAAAPDTVALLPPGLYVLRLTLKGETMEQPLKIVRSGVAVTAAMGGSDTLSGTLDPSGRLQLAGGNATDRIELGATVANGRASGQAQLGRGANRMNGSFTLDLAAQGASKLAEYGAPKPSAGGGGFFERLGKAWSCLKNWSSC